jgi:hypothetical protein
MYGYGKITPISKNKTELVYEVLVDVGGMVPKWIVNYYQGNIAYITFRNLIKKMMPLTAYEGVKYDFIKYPDFDNKPTSTVDAQEKTPAPAAEEKEEPVPTADMKSENTHK